MGKDKKKEAERQRKLRATKKEKLKKLEAFWEYAQRNNPALLQEFLRKETSREETSREEAPPQDAPLQDAPPDEAPLQDASPHEALLQQDWDFGPMNMENLLSELDDSFFSSLGEAINDSFYSYE